MDATHRLVVISGCSGGGKSTLIDALGRRGFLTVEEPARQLLREDPGANQRDPQGFAAKLLEAYVRGWKSVRDRQAIVFFDRSLLDVVSWYHRTRTEVPANLAAMVASAPYDRLVFLVPPWLEIFKHDLERTHSYESAVAEYESLAETYPAYGYDVVLVPKAGVEERADFVLGRLGAGD